MLGGLDVVGASSIFLGGVSTGSANAQVLAYVYPQGYALQVGAPVVFTPGFTNTGPATLNINGTGAKNVFKQTPAGAVALTGSELLANQPTMVVWDGTQLNVMVQVGLAANTSALLQVNGLLVDPAYFRGSLSGMQLTRASATTITFGVGSCVNDAAQIDGGSAFFLKATAALTKTLQAAGAWAAGTGQNGLFSGARAASTSYHCFAIRKDSDGSVDFGFDTSLTAANIPAGYTGRRRLWTIKTDGATNILDFKQVNDYCYWAASILDVNEAAAAVGTLKTMSAPPGVKCRLLAQATSIGSDGYVFTSPDEPDEAPSATVAPLDVQVSSPGSILPLIYTNTSNQIRYRALGGGGTLKIATLGYVDDRGRYD